MTTPEQEPTICHTCGAVFKRQGDNWYRADRMHDDRTGEGPLSFCSEVCVVDWIADQKPIGPPTPIVARVMNANP